MSRPKLCVHARINAGIRDHNTPVLLSLQNSLNSSKPNDDLFEELSSLLGFEALDLIVQVLEDRMQVAQQARSY